MSNTEQPQKSLPIRPRISDLLQDEERLVDDKIAAEILGLSNYRTMAVWRATGRNPDLKYYKIGRNVRSRIADLIAFRKKRLVG